MFHTVLLISLIAGFSAITIFSLTAMLFVRRREQAQSEERAIADLDAALDAALTEINKMGNLVKSEVNEKYQAMLFLYNLVEEKRKELPPAVADVGIVADPVAFFDSNKDEAVSADEISLLLGTPDVAPSPISEPLADVPIKRPSFTNPQHARIWDMREEGQSLAEIAKTLGIGQGEVKLILDLAKRA